MPTLRLHLDPSHLDAAASQQALAEAALILRRGGTVALPTETVYGLGASALDPAAVEKIFTAKGRPHWDPLIVHICDREMLGVVAGEISYAAERLMQAFWPGPLTLLLPRSARIPDSVTAMRPLVGVRTPRHPVALELIRRAGLPIAAPSANRFGHTSPTSAQHVLDDLDGRIDAVLDAGPTDCGLESTVLDPNSSPAIVYRPGSVTLDQIRSVCGPAELFQENLNFAAVPRSALPSPGVGLRHYAPQARLILVESQEGAAAADLAPLLYGEANAFSHYRLGVMMPEGLPGERGPEESRDQYENLAEVYPWGRWSRPEELAQRLFAGLRALDSAGCDVILCPLPPAEGIGVAIRDRLRKAATPQSA